MSTPLYVHVTHTQYVLLVTHESMMIIPTPPVKSLSGMLSYIPNCCGCFDTHMMTTIWWCANTYTASDDTTPVRWHTRIVVYTLVPVRPSNMQTMYPQFPRIRHVRTHMWSRKKVLVISVRWSVICCQEWGCPRLLFGKLGHTGLVPFVDEPGTICWEVPLEYGFEVLVGSEQQWRR